MSRYNNNTYYLVPIDEITDEMIDLADQNTRETMRKSVRPIDGKIHGILTYGNHGQIPAFMQKYQSKGFDHEKTLEIVNGSIEWNLTLPVDELRKKYDFPKILEHATESRYIEAFGLMYITIFGLLKFQFFLHCQQYLGHDIDKWRVFRSRQFESTNEYAMLQLCYFFDLLTKDERDDIDSFRTCRNDIAHSFEWTHEPAELESQLRKLDAIATRLLNSLGI